MIEVKGLVKRFGNRTILDRLDLQAKAGEWLAITGVNGAGKTTLLRILAGIASYQGGEVLIDGISLKYDAQSTRRITNLVSHQPLLYGELTAEENLRFYCGLNGIPNPVKMIDGYLKIFRLEDKRKQLTKTFSRGMQQKLSLIRAFLMDPKVLLLDEPLSNLDQESIQITRDELKRFTSNGGTIIMAMHDLDKVRPYLDRELLLQSGKLSESKLAKSRQSFTGKKAK